MMRSHWIKDYSNPKFVLLVSNKRTSKYMKQKYQIRMEKYTN